MGWRKYAKVKKTEISEISHQDDIDLFSTRSCA